MSCLKLGPAPLSQGFVFAPLILLPALCAQLSALPGLLSISPFSHAFELLPALSQADPPRSHPQVSGNLVLSTGSSQPFCGILHHFLFLPRARPPGQVRERPDCVRSDIPPVTRPSSFSPSVASTPVSPCYMAPWVSHLAASTVAAAAVQGKQVFEVCHD